MLTPQLNDMLTRTGPGTPMGEVFRRFWLPVALSSEVAEADGPPLRLKILHEDLVLFRDSEARIGLVAAHCSHRLAPLFFGRNEQGGLRCPYHGWKFDVGGACVDMPNVAQGESRRLRERAAITAYPTQEGGGLVWAYMGPAEFSPPFPAFELTRVPAPNAYAMRWLQRSNWAQGAEGEIDTSHISFLHKHFDPATNPVTGGGSEFATDGMPEITLRETDYGFHYGARRQLGEDYYWRITQWMAPMFSLIPRVPGPFVAGGGRAWTPVDDENVMCFHLFYRLDGPPTDHDRKLIETGVAFPPRLERGVVQLADGAIVDTWLPTANRGNDYLIDRKRQRQVNFSGIWGANEQDRALQESMAAAAGRPGTVDRGRELLVASDYAVVAMRKRMLALAEQAARGERLEEPFRLAAKGVRAISRISGHADYDDLLAELDGALETPDLSLAPT